MTSSSVPIWFRTSRTPSTRSTTSVISSSVSSRSARPRSRTTPSSTSTLNARTPGYLGRNLERNPRRTPSGIRCSTRIGPVDAALVVLGFAGAVEAPPGTVVVGGERGNPGTWA